MTSSGCHSAKVRSKSVVNSIVTIVTDLWHHLLIINKFMPCSFQIKSKLLPEIHSMDKFVSFKSIVNSQIQSTLVISKLKGPSETVRDIRCSTYQIFRIEENTNRTATFHK